MCDTVTVSTSIILGLWPSPGITSRYVCLALASASFILPNDCMQGQIIRVQDPVPFVGDAQRDVEDLLQEHQSNLAQCDLCAKEIKEIQTAMLLIIEGNVDVAGTVAPNPTPMFAQSHTICRCLAPNSRFVVAFVVIEAIPVFLTVLSFLITLLSFLMYEAKLSVK
ncbi:hypothetical protein B0H13DRAFT_2289000 [Mycena leptocephala]|nr:hypothetical protein B0H13DRAFT_2289000 [Mycena leptocephala]